MCGRYTLAASELDLSWLGVAETIKQIPSYNIAPGEQVLIVRESSGQGVEVVRVKWGLVPGWLEDFSRAQINARIETAENKPMFRDAFRQRRCLVLADGWYDWQRLPDRNQPWYIHPKKKGFFAFAGLWERYTVDSQLSFDSCAILTSAVTTGLKPLSDRMPVVLGKQQCMDWIRTGILDQEQNSLMESGVGTLNHYPVQSTVNRTENKQPSCLQQLHGKSVYSL